MRAWPYLALLIAGVSWGVGFPLAELALPEVRPGPLMLLRFLVAAAVCAPVALRSRASRRAFRDPWTWAAGAIYGPAFVVQFEGLAHTSVTLSALMVGVLPAMVAFIAPLIGERVTRVGWIGVAAATAGAVLIGARPGAAGTPAGVGLLLAAMVAYVVWLVVLRRVKPTAHPLDGPCAMIVVSTLALAVVVLPAYGPPPLALSLKAWTGVVGTGLVCTALATVAWQLGAARVPATSAGVFVNIEPVVGSALGVAAFHDPLTPALVVGGALIVAGSVVTVLGERPVAAEPAPPAPQVAA